MAEKLKLPIYRGLPKSGSYLEVVTDYGHETHQGYWWSGPDCHPKAILGYPGSQRASFRNDIAFGYLFLAPYDPSILSFLRGRIRTMADAVAESSQVDRFLDTLQREGYARLRLILRDTDGSDQVGFTDQYTILHGTRATTRRGKKHRMKLPEGRWSGEDIPDADA